MTQDLATFEWTAERENAAQLVAAGDLAQDAIADKLGIGRSTLYRWRKEPGFRARIVEIVDDYKRDLYGRGIARKDKRIEILNRNVYLLQQVIDGRATDPAMAKVPGGPTGLLVHDVKAIGTGDTMMVVDLYEVDTGTLKEVREHLKQAKDEMEAIEKQANANDSKPDDEPIDVTANIRSVAELELSQWQKAQQEKVSNMLNAPPTPITLSTHT